MMRLGRITRKGRRRGTRRRKERYIQEERDREEDRDREKEEDRDICMYSYSIYDYLPVEIGLFKELGKPCERNRSNKFLRGSTLAAFKSHHKLTLVFFR